MFFCQDLRFSTFWLFGPSLSESWLCLRWMYILSCFYSWWEIGEACGWRDSWNLPPSSTILRKTTTRNRISQCLVPHPEQSRLNYLRVPLRNHLQGWVATRERKKEKQLQKRSGEKCPPMVLKLRHRMEMKPYDQPGAQNVNIFLMPPWRAMILGLLSQ